MKIDRISYSESIEVYAGKWVKVGMEAELFDGDIIESSYASLKKLVSDQFATNSTELSFPRKGAGGLENYITSAPPDIQIDKSPKESAHERMISAINECTNVTVLESFKLLVKNNPEFQNAYDKKMQQLCNL